MLANLLPIPLIEVIANMIFCFPSTLVFNTRRMCWNSSFATKDYQKSQKLKNQWLNRKIMIREMESRREAYHFSLSDEGYRWTVMTAAKGVCRCG
jgi:hypothetical protein